MVNIYGAICKPIALFIINLVGLSTTDEGVHFTVAHLKIPWTRDCAGMNILLVLLSVYAWMNRNTQQNLSYWLKMLSILPLAIISNVLRILTLVTYRYVFFPEVESPQMHYSLGIILVDTICTFFHTKEYRSTKKNLMF